MEQGAKKNIFKWLAVFLIILIGTNLANYYMTSKKPGAAADTLKTAATGEDEANQRIFDPDTAIIWEALESIKDNYYYPVDHNQLVEGAVRGMIDSIDDPYIRFFNTEDLEDFISETRGSYGGIGVRVIEANKDVVVFEVFPGSPAERSGLSPGDRIVEADGSVLTGQGISRAVELLRGPANTTVDVLIKRPGADEPISLTLEREEIQVTTVFSEMLEEGPGYISIRSFDSKTAAEFTEQFRKMEQEGLGRGLIIDLRNNLGGLVDQVVEVAKLLVPEGEIVRLVGRENKVKTIYYSSAVKKPYPIVVLINEDSASAAELLAGALQDRKAALLVGKTTFGKASVQQLEYHSNDSAILLTIAKYFTPSGHDIDKHGIEPDFEIDMPEILRYYHYFHPGRLETGSYGQEVEFLQQMLVQLGYALDITGYFDEQTTLALSAFQAKSRLVSTGEFDDQTWVELREALDQASREQDEQLNFALKLIGRPDFLTILEGND